MLYIHLFGYPRFFDGETPLPLKAPPRTLPLWAFLLLNRTREMPRETLAYTLWPDLPETAALANLRRHLYHLRRLLPAAPTGKPWLLQPAGAIRWNPAAEFWLDVAEFERLSASPEHIARALALYTDDLLPPVDDDWLLVERERLRQTALADLEELVAQSRARGEIPQALAYARQLLRLDPLHEKAARDLIALRYQSGDRAGALRAYQDLARLLEQELGEDPMPETTALYEIIVQNRPLLETEPHRVTAQAECPHNLPAAVNPFFGREEDLAALHDMLVRGAPPVRLLTLTGPAGVGKTRLALEAASRLLSEQDNTFTDGIFFVDLAPVGDPQMVIPAIAAVLGVVERRGRPLRDSLKTFLQPRHILLLLDNFEQVVAAGPLVADLLAGAPHLQVLVTSRAVLSVYGEHEYPVSPLPLPDPEAAATDLRGNAAISLFAARSRERWPAFALTEENVGAVAEICVRLDGLPLAIELAARQVKLLAPDDILARLNGTLAFLEGGPCDRPARQQTLRGAIDWSYQLLPEEEKALFASLGVFAGGFTRAAAEAVCGPSCGDVAAGIAALLDKSLLQQRGGEDSPRFAMLAIIREYALEQLAQTGRLPALRRRQAEYFAGLAEQADAARKGPRQADWLQRLNAELANLRAVLAWSLGETAVGAQVEVGARLLRSLGLGFWEANGRFGEGRAWHEKALAHRDSLSLEMQTWLLNGAGWMLQLQGEYPAAESLHQEALELAREGQDRRSLHICLHMLGAAAGRQGDYRRARVLLTEALAEERAASGGAMSVEVGILLNNLAIVFKHLGAYDRAEALLRESLDYKQAQGDQRGVAASLSNLGNVALARQDYARAQEYCRESLLLRRALEDKKGMLVLLSSLADLALAQEQPVRSARLYGACVALHQAFTLAPGAAGEQEYERDLAILRERLGPADFAAAWALGASMTLEQAVDYALKSDTDSHR